MKIRRGDTVVVITGKDKGKSGQVLRVLDAKNRVVVSDINMRTRHVKATPNRAGEIVKYEAAIHASNVMLLDPKSGKPTRVGFKIDAKGRKMRIARKSGEEIVKTKLATKATKKAAKTGAEVKTSEDVTDQQKKPAFWRKMGFGSEAMNEIADVDAGSHMQEDHSVPEQGKRESTRSHSRGT